MSQKFWTRSVLAVTLVTAAAGTFSPASTAPAATVDKNPPPMEDRHDGRYMDKFIARLEKELDLTPAQTAQIRAILRPDSLVPPPEGMPPHMGPGMPMFSDEFIAQLRSNTVDTAALNRTFAERQQMMAKHHAEHVSKFVQIHAVLTPAQRTKLADLWEKRRDKAAKEHRAR